MNKPRQFEETAAAADLLRRFFKVTQRIPTPLEPPARNAAETFFDKQYLSIMEFLAPVGSDLKKQVSEQRNDSVAAFFDLTIRPRRLVTKPLVETIAQFLNRLQ